MSTVNLQDLINAAEEVEDSGFESGYELPQGKLVSVKVVDSRPAIQDDGTPRFGMWLEITDGDDKGNRFWVFPKFSAQHAFVTKKALAVLNALGIDNAFIGGNTPDMIGAALVGREAVVKGNYRKNKKNPDRPWEDHLFSPKKVVAPAAPVDDDEDYYDDED